LQENEEKQDQPPPSPYNRLKNLVADSSTGKNFFRSMSPTSLRQQNLNSEDAQDQSAGTIQPFSSLHHNGDNHFSHDDSIATDDRIEGGSLVHLQKTSNLNSESQDGWFAAIGELPFVREATNMAQPFLCTAEGQFYYQDFDELTTSDVTNPSQGEDK